MASFLTLCYLLKPLKTLGGDYLSLKAIKEYKHAKNQRENLLPSKPLKRNFLENML